MQHQRSPPRSSPPGQSSLTKLQDEDDIAVLRAGRGNDQNVLRYVRTRLTQAGAVPPQQPAMATALTRGPPSALVDSRAGRIKWVQPSGPRLPGEGVENEEQGIVNADNAANGTIIVKTTLLAAGFLIGPSGMSVRDINRVTGAEVTSWTESPLRTSDRPVRTFNVQGTSEQKAHALYIMSKAIDRYKELCEGRYAGQVVQRLQRVAGIDFCYQPPPRHVVPHAAALKNHNSPTRFREMSHQVEVADIASAMNALAVFNPGGSASHCGGQGSECYQGQECSHESNEMVLQQIVRPLAALLSSVTPPPQPEPPLHHQAPQQTSPPPTASGVSPTAPPFNSPGFSLYSGNNPASGDASRSGGRCSAAGSPQDQPFSAAQRNMGPGLQQHLAPPPSDVTQQYQIHGSSGQPSSGCFAGFDPAQLPTPTLLNFAAWRPQQATSTVSDFVPANLSYSTAAQPPPPLPAANTPPLDSASEHSVCGFGSGNPTPTGPLSRTVSGISGCGAPDTAYAPSPAVIHNPVGDQFDGYFGGYGLFASGLQQPAQRPPSLWAQPPQAGAAAVVAPFPAASYAASHSSGSIHTASGGTEGASGGGMHPATPPRWPRFGATGAGASYPSSPESPSLAELRASADAAFRAASLQPFSMSELNARGFVPVPASEGFHFPTSDAAGVPVAPWISDAQHPILSRRASDGARL